MGMHTTTLAVLGVDKGMVSGTGTKYEKAYPFMTLPYTVARSTTCTCTLHAKQHNDKGLFQSVYAQPVHCTSTRYDTKESTLIHHYGV